MYLAGLMVIFASAYSQYLFRGIGPMIGMLLVYGIPLLITGYIWGSAIVKKALTHTYSALKVGIGLFGAFTVLGTLTGALVFYVLSTLDPTAVNLLHKPNPVLQISPEFAWIMVAVSFLIIGPAEEYLFRGSGPVTGMLLVYGIPLLVTGYIWGSAIVKKAFGRTYSALKVGVGLFGAFTVLGTLTGVLIFYVLETLDPAAVNLLHKPNPILQISPEFAWIMVAASFLIIGPVEEYLSRGFIYGGLLDLFKGRHWIGLGLVSSVLFATAHLYYAFVYEVASLVQFVDLMTFGMAMAVTCYLSGGNLFAVALIHGAYDATGFIGVATSLGVGTSLRGLMILVGAIVAIGLFAQKMRKKRAEHLQHSG